MKSSYYRDHPSYHETGNAGTFRDRDEGYASYSSNDRSQEYIRPSFGRHHNNFQFQSPADIHGDALKLKFNQTQPLEKSPARSLLSSSVNRLLLQRTSVERQFRAALSLPAQISIRSGGNPGSLARTTETPIHSALYPRSTLFCHSDRSPRTRIKGNNCYDAFSTHSSYEFAGPEGREMQDGQSLKRLHNDDTYASAGQKRRAASPNYEYMFSTPSDTSCRRDSSSRRCPQGRFTSIALGASMPSVSTSTSNLYISTVPTSIHPTSIVTANSFGRCSPVGPSPGGISPTSCNSPYPAPGSFNPNPQTSISSWESTYPETTPYVSTSKVIKVQTPNATNMKGFFMCKCCSKKPNRFDTIEELESHEAKKPHKCSFCGNRFKNKNEADRHKASLHVRHHSWSCSALSGYDQAFQDSTTKPGEADICGYCGDEFSRSGRGPGTGPLSGDNSPRHATEQDGNERARHLHEVHKLKECNLDKKFFRADHFKQHLKHSHAGTIGKWTTTLENACMSAEGTNTR